MSDQCLISRSRCLRITRNRALMAFFVDICIFPPRSGARRARGRATRDEADLGVVLTACCPAGQSRISIPRFEAALSPHSVPLGWAQPPRQTIEGGLANSGSLSLFLLPAPNGSRGIQVPVNYLAHVAGFEPATVPRGLPGGDSNPLSALPGQDACSTTPHMGRHYLRRIRAVSSSMCIIHYFRSPVKPLPTFRPGLWPPRPRLALRPLPLPFFFGTPRLAMNLPRQVFWVYFYACM